MENEQSRERFDLQEEIDKTIKTICKKVNNADYCIGECADIVKALAELVTARALL